MLPPMFKQTKMDMGQVWSSHLKSFYDLKPQIWHVLQSSDLSRSIFGILGYMRLLEVDPKP